MRLLLTVALAFCLITSAHGETPAEHIASTYAAHEMTAAPINGNLPDYTLQPATLAQAQHLQTIVTTLHFGGILYALLQFMFLLALGIVARMRDFAASRTRHRWLQAFIFLFLFLLARSLLNLPLNLYGHHLSIVYGFSVQHWASWLLDLAKSFALTWLVEGALALIFFWIIAKFPRRWWLACAVAAIPITLLGVWLTPIVIDPIFNHFEPLALHHPALAAELEHMGVPANHQFLMQASAKVTTPNAYVTGLGPSKRIIVWDTSLNANQPKASSEVRASPEVLWMVGHECGHYALHHILIGTSLALAALPLAFYLIYHFVQFMLRRFGARFCIPSQTDWATIALLLLAINLINIPAEPISNTISRHIEHAADIYGEEAIHGLVSSPQAAVQTAIQTDGQRGLELPNPAPWIELWTYNHPAAGRRAAFGKAYDPWAAGMEPKYFKKQ